jgi:hypothetical protein
MRGKHSLAQKFRDRVEVGYTPDPPHNRHACTAAPPVTTNSFGLNLKVDLEINQSPDYGTRFGIITTLAKAQCYAIFLGFPCFPYEMVGGIDGATGRFCK